MTNFDDIEINDSLTIYFETLRFFKIAKHLLYLKRFQIYRREFWNNVSEHTHPYFELLIPLKGGVQYSVLNNPIPIDNDQHIIIIPPGTPHIRNIITNGDIIVIIQFTLEGQNSENSVLADTLTEKLEQNQYRLDIMNNSWLYDIIDLCLKRPPLWQDFISNLMEKFFLTLFASCSGKMFNSNYDNDKKVSHSGKNIKRLEQMIEISLDSRLSLGEYAAKIGVSKRQIERLIKQYHNTTFSEYLKHRRFSVAKSLLSNSGYSVKEVADAIGYDDVSYFCRVFKQYSGMTPLEYQKKK